MATCRLLSLIAGTLWVCALGGGAATTATLKHGDDGHFLTPTHTGAHPMQDDDDLLGWQDGDLSVMDSDELNDMFVDQEKDDDGEEDLYTALKKRFAPSAHQRIPNVFIAARGRRVDPGAFYGARGRRAPPANAFFGARGKKETPTVDAFFGARGRRIPSASGFFGVRGKKSGPPTSAFYSVRGKKDVPSSQFYGARGKKDPPPSGFFGARGKKAVPSSAFYGSRGRRIPPGGFHSARGKRVPPTGFFGARGRRSDVYDLSDMNDSNRQLYNHMPYNYDSSDNTDSSLDDLRDTMEYFMKIHNEEDDSPHMSSLRLKRQPPSGFNAIRG